MDNQKKDYIFKIFAPQLTEEEAWKLMGFLLRTFGKTPCHVLGFSVQEMEQEDPEQRKCPECGAALTYYAGSIGTLEDPPEEPSWDCPNGCEVE